MIARIWHGTVPAAKAEEYLERMRNVALPYFNSTLGNRGAFCLWRADGDSAHFDMLTFWEDVEAITRFVSNENQTKY
jgi:heme-degrading monooxygenase HmoA